MTGLPVVRSRLLEWSLVAAVVIALVHICCPYVSRSVVDSLHQTVLHVNQWIT